MSYFLAGIQDQKDQISSADKPILGRGGSFATLHYITTENSPRPRSSVDRMTLKIDRLSRKKIESIDPELYEGAELARWKER